MTGVLDFGKQRMTPEQAAANWGKMYSQRYDSDDPYQQDIAAAADHRAYTRNVVNERPILGAPAMLGFIPAYNLAKKVGILEGGSTPSMYSMAEAYRGLGEGAGDVLHRILMMLKNKAG